MGQVVIADVSFQEYAAARVEDFKSPTERVLMKLFEAKGIVMRGDQPAPPADVVTDADNERFVIRQEQ